MFLWKDGESLMRPLKKKKGDERIRTADGGFADPCLATWLRRQTPAQ
jgi:hypothetical protein